jgi:transposase
MFLNEYLERNQSSMTNEILFVALDVDDKSFHGAAIPAQCDKIEDFVCRPQLNKLIECLEQFKKRGFDIKICYEATYLGFSLYRDLKKAGFDCQVIAPALIPEMRGNKVKTDRLDSRKLALYFKSGLLTAVHVPTEQDEAVRGLLRGRAFLVSQRKALKLHISALCRRHGLNYRQEMNQPQANYWTQAHTNWVRSKAASKELHSALTVNLRMLLHQMEDLSRQIEAYEREIKVWSLNQSYEKKASTLMAFRGIETITAMSLITELGDMRRFSHPAKLTSYVGLDIKEYSSGGKERKGRITKLGNRYIRTLLLEANQGVSRKPIVGRDLKDRRKKAHQEAVAIASRCMERLYKKSTRMAFREKPANKIKVACAREMLGFIWEAMTKAETFETSRS